MKKNDEIPEDLIVDYSEMILDSILEEGGLKEARIIKTLLSIYKSVKGNKDYYTTKKIYAFLFGCKYTARVQPRRFIDFLKYETDFMFYICSHYMISKYLCFDILELKKFKYDSCVITSNNKLIDAIVMLLYIYTLNQYLVTAKLINPLKVSVKDSETKFFSMITTLY